jgi:hypothetical protein
MLSLGIKKMDTYKTIIGYLIIPLWIICFVLTTLVFIVLAINAWISRMFLKKSKAPVFNQRSIFPYESDH